MKKLLLSTHICFCFFALNSQTPTEQWNKIYNGKGDFSDRYNCMKTDNAGNSYVAGYTVKESSKKDYLLSKINSSGTTVWSQTFNGLGSKDDEVLSMFLTNTNIYITGYSKGNATSDDIVTMKYDLNGNNIWSATYNNAANENDQGNGIVVDASGNVYVTGQTDIDASAVDNDNFITLKYNSNGVQQWVKTYNGTGNSTDRSIGLTLDNSSNCIITGRSNNGTNDDFVTIKYDPLGNVLWTKTLNKNYDDRPIGICSDNSGNIYVTGRSNNSADDDILTIKYSSSGTELWSGGVTYAGVADNDRPSAIALDGVGNVIVTGKTDNDPSSTTNYDFCTIKYNTSGVEQWVKTYSGIGDGTDESNTLIIDGNNNYYIAGRTDIDNDPNIERFNLYFISYNTNGNVNWENSWNGSANKDENCYSIGLGLNSSINIVGYAEDQNSQKNGIVININSSGTFSWLNSFNGTGDNSDNVNAITTFQNYSYLAGYTYNQSTEKDMLIIKIDNSTGDTIWTRSINGTDNNSDEAVDIVTDNTGNIYFTGFSKESTSDYDVATYKFDANGNQVWKTLYNNSSANGEDKGAKIFIDGNGNVFVTGVSDGNASNTIENLDFVTIKYNNSGVQQWATRYNGTGNLSDTPVDIVALNSGKVFVSGMANNGSDDDIVTICYNATGVQQWIKIIDSGNGNDRPSDIELDVNGNLIVSCKKDNGSGNDIYTIQYTALGVENWNHTFTNTNDNRPVSIATANDGSIYVTGTSDNGSDINILIYQITNSGQTGWNVNYDGGNQLNDEPTKILYDNYGSVLIGGFSNSSTTNNDFVLLKYKLNGDFMWKVNHNETSNMDDEINSFTLNSDHDAIVCGKSVSSTQQKNILVIKYNASLGLYDFTLNESDYKVFPNPLTENSILKLNNTRGELIRLSILSSDGKELNCLETNSDEIALDKHNYNSGVYLIKVLRLNQETETIKFIIQ